MNPLYLRQTRAVPVTGLPETLRRALSDWSEQHQLTLDDVRAWHTHSTNPPADGFFARLLRRRSNTADPDSEHDSVLVLHPTHLVVGTTGASRGTSVFGLPLMQASVARGSRLAESLRGAAPTDDGISIEGFPGTEGRPGTWFFGMGAPDADACYTAVEAAVRVQKGGSPKGRAIP